MNLLFLPLAISTLLITALLVCLRIEAKQFNIFIALNMKLTPSIINTIRQSEWLVKAREAHEYWLSPSSTAGWSCPSKFLLSKVLRLESCEADKSKAEFGKLFHSFLETGELPDNATPELKLAISEYERKKDKRLVLMQHEVEFKIQVSSPQVKPTKVMLHGIIDALGTYDGIPCVIEHKVTQSQNIASFCDAKHKSNQALAYCFHSGLRFIVFNIIQRTRSGSINVVTNVRQVTDDEVDEWQEEIVDGAHKMLANVMDSVNYGYSAVNRDICFTPFKCEFCDFCGTALQNKDNILESLYKTKDK